MIGSACTFIYEALSRYLYLQFRLAEDKIVLTNLINQDGTVNDYALNKFVITLFNVEQETVMGNGGDAYSRAGNGNFSKVNPPVSLNAYLLFTANFSGKNYPDGLDYLSGVVSFFQDNIVFNHQNSPGLDPAIDKLTMEIVNLGSHDLSHIWGAMGGKYAPSMIYKMRMLTFQPGRIKSAATAVEGLGGNPLPSNN